MLSSLFSTITKRPFGNRSHPTNSLPPRLEVLEDRCLLSATTVPSDVNPFVVLTGPGDVFVASQPKGNPGVVFLGDSIAGGYYYGTGTPVWSAFMAPLGAADYGVGGQTTQTLLFQLSLGQLVGINPSVAVLIIGTNNLIEGDSPQATAAGVLADVNTIHAYLPATQILVLATPPGAPSPNDPYRRATEQTDALVAQMLAGDTRATFVNIAPALEQANGTISNLVEFDYIHPTVLGYFDMTLALIVPIEQAALTSDARMEASLWGGLFGEAFPLLSFSTHVNLTESSGLRSLIF